MLATRGRRILGEEGIAEEREEEGGRMGSFDGDAIAYCIFLGVECLIWDEWNDSCFE